MNELYQGIKTGLLLGVLVLVGALIRLAVYPEILTAPVIAEVQETRREVLELVKGQTDKALKTVDGAIKRADTGVNRALELAEGVSRTLTAPETGVLATVRGESAATRQMVDGQLTAINSTVGTALKPFGALAARYTLLPDELKATAAPVWASLEPEITCRRPDGAGYGGCMRARVNGVLGELQITGAQITKDSPMFLKAITGVATDAHTFTSRAVAPRGKWGTVKDILGTGSGVVRAGAAAGLF